MVKRYCFFEDYLTFFICDCEGYVIGFLFPDCNVINVACDCRNRIGVDKLCFAVLPALEVITVLLGINGKLCCFTVSTVFGVLIAAVACITCRSIGEFTAVCIEYK